MVDWVWVTDTLLQLTGILAWPLVVVVVGVLFRAELVGLVRRLSKLKLPGGTEVEFGQLLEKAEAKLPEAKKDLETAFAKIRPKEPKETKPAKASRGAAAPFQAYIWTVDTDFQELLDLAQRDPNLALAGLRIEIERMLRDMAESSFNMEHFLDVRTAGALLASLTRLEIVPRSVALLLTDVLKLCNPAVHGVDVGRDDAIRVISAASDFQTFYRNWAQHVKPNLPK